VDLESGEFTCGAFVMPGRGSTFSPDGTRVTFQDEEGWVPVVEARTGRVLCRSIKHSSNLISVRWSPDGRRLLTAGYDDAVLVWDPATGTQVVPPLRSPAGPARLARWSPDGRLVVTRHEREARVWDAVTGEAVTPRLQHPQEVVTALMTAGRRLITASRPNLLRAWDLQPSRLPAEVLSDYARYLSGRRVDRGMVLPLTAGEMEALDRALRTRAPELFH
jgi:WD40 repeat protein